MAINLHINHLNALAQDFKAKSYLKGKTSDKYSFTGLKGVKISTLRSVPLTPYTRAGVQRYGTPVDMQDSIQEMVVSQDDGFAVVVDAGDNTEQQMIKNAAKAMRVQMDEQVVPLADKYGFYKMAYNAGKIVTSTTALTKTTAVTALSDAIVAMQDANVPVEQCYIAATSAFYALLKLSPEYLSLENPGEKALLKGVVGEFMSAKVMRVPTSYLGDYGIDFVVWHPSAVVFPEKLHNTKIHESPPGIDGALLEGRFIYDLFVLGAKSNAVYVRGTSMARATDPIIAITKSSNTYTATVTVATGDTCYITTDGTDPRYSSSRAVYSAPVDVDVTQGDAPAEIRTNGGKFVVKAVSYKANNFPSDVITAAEAV